MMTLIHMELPQMRDCRSSASEASDLILWYGCTVQYYRYCILSVTFTNTTLPVPAIKEGFTTQVVASSVTIHIRLLKLPSMPIVRSLKAFSPSVPRTLRDVCRHVTIVSHSFSSLNTSSLLSPLEA